MKIKKTGIKTRPLRVTPSKGHPFYVPNQKKYKSEFIQDHGCSLVAFYIALSFLGKKRAIKKILKWSKKNLKIKSKIPLSEVYKGIRKLAPSKKNNVTFRRKVTAKEVRTALARGHLVILETKDPTHSNPLLWDDTKCCVRNFSHGGKEKINVDKYVKNQCKNDTYRGCIFVKP